MVMMYSWCSLVASFVMVSYMVMVCVFLMVVYVWLLVLGECSLIGFIAPFVYVVHSCLWWFMAVYRHSWCLSYVLLFVSCLLCPLVLGLKISFCGFIRVFRVFVSFLSVFMFSMSLVMILVI